MNWFKIVEFFQSICHSKTGEGAKTETDEDVWIYRNCSKHWNNLKKLKTQSLKHKNNIN